MHSACSDYLHRLCSLPNYCYMINFQWEWSPSHFLQALSEVVLLPQVYTIERFYSCTRVYYREVLLLPCVHYRKIPCVRFHSCHVYTMERFYSCHVYTIEKFYSCHVYTMERFYSCHMYTIERFHSCHVYTRKHCRLNDYYFCRANLPLRSVESAKQFGLPTSESDCCCVDDSL
jgi:hypothetical protein